MAEHIDREAFKKSIEERYCKPCKAEGKDHNGCWCRACWVDDMLDEVECFSPSDVAPVVHGRWVDEEPNFTHGCYRHSAHYQCSVCGRRTGKAQTRNYRYCPKCGARMDGDA